MHAYIFVNLSWSVTATEIPYPDNKCKLTISNIQIPFKYIEAACTALPQKWNCYNTFNLLYERAIQNR